MQAAQMALADFGEQMPAVQSAELYLIEALSSGPAGNGGGPYSVIFPPEFVVLMDLGWSALAAGEVFWKANSYGDPGFPEKNPVILRSVAGRSPDEIIYPNVVSSVIITPKDGVDPKFMLDDLAALGLRAITIEEYFLTAECTPFREIDFCARIAALASVKHVSTNPIQRLGDFGPGWTLKRLL